MKFLNKNSFVLFLFVAVLLAFIFPEWGAKNGPLKAGLFVKLGIMLIFFLQGLSLKTSELANGLKEFKLHLFIQIWIFLLSPLILIMPAFLLKSLQLTELSDGFLFLALLPTTISSAVALTTSAGGNVSASIFNTTISNIFGVFWVPLASVFIFTATADVPDGLVIPLLIKLSWLIILPLFLGQCVRPAIFNAQSFKRVRPHFKSINNGIIVFIVFTAFCQSVLDDSWSGIPSWSILLLIGLTILSVVLVHAAVWASSQWFIPDVKNRVTALFCGSQKTLAAGAPIALAIFATPEFSDNINLGLLLLPLMCYHPIQLFTAAFLIPHLQKQTLKL